MKKNIILFLIFNFFIGIINLTNANDLNHWINNYYLKIAWNINNINLENCKNKINKKELEEYLKIHKPQVCKWIDCKNHRPFIDYSYLCSSIKISDKTKWKVILWKITSDIFKTKSWKYFFVIRNNYFLKYDDNWNLISFSWAILNVVDKDFWLKKWDIILDWIWYLPWIKLGSYKEMLENSDEIKDENIRKIVLEESNIYVNKIKNVYLVNSYKLWTKKYNLTHPEFSKVYCKDWKVRITENSYFTWSDVDKLLNMNCIKFNNLFWIKTEEKNIDKGSFKQKSWFEKLIDFVKWIIGKIFW